MNTKTRLVIAAAVLGIGIPVIGLAQAENAAPAPETMKSGVPSAQSSAMPPGAPWLEKDELIRRLESQGFSGIRDFEPEKGILEVKARDADGRRMELKVDPVTGTILKAKKDD